jgi:hypothetical protein
MKSGNTFASGVILLLCMIACGATTAFGTNGQQRDSLRSLRRAISEANATALTTEQEAQINTLITNYKAALPDDSDDTLDAAREAFDAAILAGDLTAAQAQTAIIANRTAALAAARLQAEAGFEIGVLASLKSGGQFDPLIAKFGNERVLGLVSSLIGRPFNGGEPRPR